MFTYLSQLPDIVLFFLITSVLLGISVIALFIVKRIIPLETRYKDNSVIGNIGAIIGIIYGVLVGLTALYLINNISYTADAVQREANAAADLYRSSKWLKDPVRTNIQSEIKNYLNTVITIEWPTMQKGQNIKNEGETIIEKISHELSDYHIKNSSETLIMSEMLGGVKSLYDAREQRIHMSLIELNPEMWIVILIGTILTIGINYLFGINFYMHIVTVCATAFMASSMIFLLISLNQPFQGDFIVEPTALKSVLTFIEKNNT